MKVLELFCGTKSIGKAFEAAGHEVYTVDWDGSFEPSLTADIGSLSAADLIRLCGGRPDVVWASPDCTTYSVAAISRHRKKVAGELLPTSEYAEKCDAVNAHVVELIRELDPMCWFIENPRGGMRKMGFVKGLPRYTVTYWQYGDRRMKPTDIWTNHPNPRFKPPCKNGAPCHDSAPRSSTVRKMKEAGIEVKVGGTQYSMRDKRERARIPEELCEHVVRICEEEYDG